MSRAKQASKRRKQKKTVTALGVAGMLSLVSGASVAAVDPPADTPTENTARVITLGEEEISDVSLSTFYVFDSEKAEEHHPRLQLAQRRACRGYRGYACGSCGGCGGCGSHVNTNGGCGGGVDNY